VGQAQAPPDRRREGVGWSVIKRRGGQEERMGREEGGLRVMMPRRMRLIEWVDASGGARVEGAVALVCGS